uniref:Fibronectin type-III domain-containing protein n=1 Tax=Pygocentrus nattereri TaxID=42514 RepID=A0A3B4CX99_PYGNA
GSLTASGVSGLEKCDVFPSNQLIKYGLDLRVSFRAPPKSDCRKITSFNTNRLYWTLNNQTIAKSFYHSNSTFASVFIQDFTLAVGIVECHLDDIVLGGTVIRTYCEYRNIVYLLFTSVQICANCIHFINQWILRMCPVSLKHCIIVFYASNTLRKLCCIPILVKLDKPRDVQVKPELSALSVTWRSNNWALAYTVCEVRFLEKGSEPVVRTVEKTSSSTFDLTEVKPCTSYSVSVRCRIDVWSEWSQAVTHFTSINVSNVQLHLWRSEGVVYAKGKRAMHLMWKGINPLCKVFDEYRLFNRTHNLVTSKSFKPSENHTVVILDENAHSVTVAAYRNNQSLSEASMEIPSAFNLPPVDNVNMFARDGQIHITWDKLYLTVTGYIVIWNSTEEDHQWQQTQERHFSLEAQNDMAFRNVTVDQKENGVILDDLQPKTNYIVYVQASSMAASSNSSFYTFSTKPYGKYYCFTFLFFKLWLGGLGLITLQNTKHVPNPRFSSLTIWSSQKCRNVRLLFFSLYVPLIYLEAFWSTDYSILATSIRDVAKLQQNTATQETTPTTHTENTALVSSSSETELASRGKEERIKPLSEMDLETAQIHPVFLSRSPYKNQTPLTSPVDSPRKGLQGTTKPRSSEETETLLKPKHDSATMVTTYVTVDMFEHGKRK